MHILFVADPLETFKIYKDTSFAMMREAQRRGHQVHACEPQDMVWQSGGKVEAQVRSITLTGAADWFTEDAPSVKVLASFDAIVMRKDPPFDSEYFYATHLLEQAEREGAKVFNRPGVACRSVSCSPASISWRACSMIGCGGESCSLPGNEFSCGRRRLVRLPPRFVGVRALARAALVFGLIADTRTAAWRGSPPRSRR